MKGTVILVFLPLLASCGAHSSQDAGLSPAELLVKQVVPEGSGGGCASPTTSVSSVTVICDLTTSWSEDSYRVWIDQRLSGRFRIRENSRGHLLMTRDGEGEVQQFDISTSSQVDSPNRIRIVLTVYAD